MFITGKHLSRRTFLRSTIGGAMALPLLDAMVPAVKGASAATAPPLRFAAIYMPNGVPPQLWHPASTGRGFAFQPIMRPLEQHRSRLVTLSQLTAPGGSIHLGASSAWLNGVGPVGAAGDLDAIQSKKSLDQFIADAIAGDTPLRSLELGTEDMGTSGGACDGYPCVFFNTLSWRDDTSPLPVGINPRVTFEQMFGEPGTPAQRRGRLSRQRSLLDSFADEARSLRQRLGRSDIVILDAYLADIRTIEKQLDRLEMRASTLTGVPDAPIGIPEAFDDHITVTYDLMQLAFRADITRVCTFLLGYEGTGRGYAHIGVPQRHHSVSHHGNRPNVIEAYAKICTYQVTKFADFLTKLQATPDGDGTLLDHSLLYWGSGMSNGNAHDRNSPPALVVGGAKGRLKGDRHIAVEQKEPTANLLLGLAHLAGVEIPRIGASTRALSI